MVNTYRDDTLDRGEGTSPDPSEGGECIWKTTNFSNVTNGEQRGRRCSRGGGRELIIWQGGGDFIWKTTNFSNVTNGGQRGRRCRRRGGGDWLFDKAEGTIYEKLRMSLIARMVDRDWDGATWKEEKDLFFYHWAGNYNRKGMIFH